MFFLFCLFTNFCKPLIPDSGLGRYINNNNNNNNNSALSYLYHESSGGSNQNFTKPPGTYPKIMMDLC